MTQIRRITYLSPWIWKYKETTFSEVELKQFRTSSFRFFIFSKLSCFLFGLVETVTIISPFRLIRTIKWYQKSHSSPLSITNLSKTYRMRRISLQKASSDGTVNAVYLNRSSLGGKKSHTRKTIITSWRFIARVYRVHTLIFKLNRANASFLFFNR